MQRGEGDKVVFIECVNVENGVADLLRGSDSNRVQSGEDTDLDVDGA